MLGKVVLEEAFELPSLAEQNREQAAQYIAPHTIDQYIRQIKSITDECVSLSDAHGIGYTIISLTVPGI